MFTPDQYQLIDFGNGRRLERFGKFTLDRPAPAVESIGKATPGAWQQADARFDRADGDQGEWTRRGELPERWTIEHGRSAFELKCTIVGHLGIFP